MTIEELAAIIGRKVVLRKRGNRYLGLCPFHDDKHPSLAVYWASRRGEARWGCYPCNLDGRAADWLKAIGESATFTPDPEFRWRRREQRRRERMLAAVHDHQPELPHWADPFIG